MMVTQNHILPEYRSREHIPSVQTRRRTRRCPHIAILHSSPKFPGDRVVFERRSGSLEPRFSRRRRTTIQDTCMPQQHALRTNADDVFDFRVSVFDKVDKIGLIGEWASRW